jgi:FAD/FMN-containing dehydrogenase
MTTVLTDLFLPLRERLTGSLVTSTDGYWDVARAAWVLSVDQRPSAVVHAESAADVAATIGFAREHGLRVAPRAPGTTPLPSATWRARCCSRPPACAASRSTPSGAPPGSRPACCGRSSPRRPPSTGWPGSSAPPRTSGVVGYTVGGGLSWFGRKHGLACSALLAAEVVTADGQVRRVDADHDADLLWALRGGGGGVAVVTALELRLWPLREVQAGALFWPAERGPEVWRAWRSWVDTLPDDTTTWARYMSFPPIPDVPEPLRGNAFVVVEACHLGDATRRPRSCRRCARSALCSTRGRPSRRRPSAACTWTRSSRCRAPARA